MYFSYAYKTHFNLIASRACTHTHTQAKTSEQHSMIKQVLQVLQKKIPERDLSFEKAINHHGNKSQLSNPKGNSLKDTQIEKRETRMKMKQPFRRLGTRTIKNKNEKEVCLHLINTGVTDWRPPLQMLEDLCVSRPPP